MSGRNMCPCARRVVRILGIQVSYTVGLKIVLPFPLTIVVLGFVSTRIIIKPSQLMGIKPLVCLCASKVEAGADDRPTGIVYSSATPNYPDDRLWADERQP